MAKPNDDKCKPRHKVKVTLNGDKVKIDSDTYKISNLKVILGVPSDYELDIIEDSQFKPLPDNDEITICGNEEFISHVKCGGSS